MLACSFALHQHLILEKKIVMTYENVFIMSAIILKKSRKYINKQVIVRKGYKIKI